MKFTHAIPLIFTPVVLLLRLFACADVHVGIKSIPGRIVCQDQNFILNQLKSCPSIPKMITVQQCKRLQGIAETALALQFWSLHEAR